MKEYSKITEFFLQGLDHLIWFLTGGKVTAFGLPCLRHMLTVNHLSDLPSVAGKTLKTYRSRTVRQSVKKLRHHYFTY